MKMFYYNARTLVSFTWIIWASSFGVLGDIGVNWGILSSQRLAPSIVVKLLQANHIMKVKLFDADPKVLEALIGSDIQVMVGITNDLLETLSSSSEAADMWVRDNVVRYAFNGGVNIMYILIFWLSMCLYQLYFISSFGNLIVHYTITKNSSLQQVLTSEKLNELLKLIK